MTAFIEQLFFIKVYQGGDVSADTVEMYTSGGTDEGVPDEVDRFVGGGNHAAYVVNRADIAPVLASTTPGRPQKSWPSSSKLYTHTTMSKMAAV